MKKNNFKKFQKISNISFFKKSQNSGFSLHILNIYLHAYIIIIHELFVFEIYKYLLA